MGMVGVITIILTRSQTRRDHAPAAPAGAGKPGAKALVVAVAGLREGIDAARSRSRIAAIYR